MKELPAPRRKRVILTDELIARVVELNRERCPADTARALGISAVTVCRVLQREGITPKRKEYAWSAEPPARDAWKNRRDADGAPLRNVTPNPLRDPKPPPLTLSPVEAAKRAFGGRLSVTADRMTLDGRDIGLTKLMQKVNEKHVVWGEPQIVSNPAWKITVARSDE